jgi:DNA-binding MarR family transcriptional regulator
MTQLKRDQEIIQEAIKRASADESRREFIGKDKEGKSLFAMPPYPLLFNKFVTAMDIGVYSVILGYCKMRKTNCVRISQRKIADVLSTSQQVVSRSAKTLEKLDWLEIEEHPKATNTYCPRTTETIKAKEIRLSKSKTRKKNRLQKLFLKQLAEAEEAKKNFLNGFKGLSDEEAIKFYKENSEFMDYIRKEE